jgi:hypothetical protein
MLGGMPQAAPVPESEVRIFLNQGDVPSTCRQYALIHMEGSADMTNESMMIRAAQRRAGKIGANGVLLAGTRDPSTGTRVASALLGISANRKGQMIAYRCDAGTPAAAPADSTARP